MAIVSSPALSMRARGSVGSITYSEWRSIAIAKTRSNPTQPGTAAQLATQKDFKDVVQKWKTLTSAEADVWKDLARDTVKINRLGQSYRPTGFNLFVSRNLNRKKVNLTVQDLPVSRETDSGILSITRIPYTSGSFVVQAVYIVDGTSFPLYRFGQIAGPYESGNRMPIESDWCDGVVTKRGVRSTDWYGLTVGKYYWVRLQGVYVSGEVTEYHHLQHLIT